MQHLSLEELKKRIERLNRKNPNFSGQETLSYKMMEKIVFLMQEDLEQKMTKYGISGNSWMVLMMVYNSEKEQIIASQVCESLGSNKSTMTRIVDTLIEKGLLTREYGFLDRRKIFLKITKSGKQIIENHIDSHSLFMNKIWEGIDVKLVSQNLEKLLTNLEKLRVEKVEK